MEVKRYQKIAAFRFFEQAEEDAQEGEIPVVLMREDRAKTWWVCHRIEDTGELCKRLNEQIHSDTDPKTTGS